MTYHALGGELYGSAGTWGFARGGMGAVSGAIAAAAREAGAAFFKSNRRRRRSSSSDGRAVGVRLANGLKVVRAATSSRGPIRRRRSSAWFRTVRSNRRSASASRTGRRRAAS